MPLAFFFRFMPKFATSFVGSCKMVALFEPSVCRRTALDLPLHFFVSPSSLLPLLLVYGFWPLFLPRRWVDLQEYTAFATALQMKPNFFETPSPQRSCFGAYPL